MNRIPAIFVMAFCLLAHGVHAQEKTAEETTAEQQIAHREKERRNIIAISPVQYTAGALGVGLSYERMLGKTVSLYVPFMGALHSSYQGRPEYQNVYTPGGDRDRATAMYYTMPGLKFYPTGRGKMKYAVGPSLMVGYGSQYMHSRYYYADQLRPMIVMDYKRVERKVLGMMVNNSLNMQATRHLYMGAELGLGVTYLDMADDDNIGPRPVVQGAFKIGYTF